MENELIVRVEHPAIPPILWNEDEVRKNIDEKLAKYAGRVYTPESIRDAKADRAEVNSWDRQLGAAVTAAKKLYMKPLEDFQQSIREMQTQCKKVSGAIDAQVKAVEDAEKQDKTNALRLVYRDCIGELEPLIPFERLFVPQWLNKTCDLAKASRELRKTVEVRRQELAKIRDLCGEDTEACTLEYLRALDLNAALSEHTRLQADREKLQRAEAERLAAQRVRASAPVITPPSEEERQIAAEAAAEVQANAHITAEGRLDFSGLQTFAAPEAPARMRYRFWVEFTPEDIEWFRQGAAQRGFKYGSIK